MARKITISLLFLVAYCGLVLAALAPASLFGASMPIWAAGALLLAVLLHADRSQWPLFLALAALGSLLSAWLFAAAPAILGAVAIAHAGEGLIAALLLKRRKRQGSELLRAWLADAGAMGALAPAAGALCVATVAHLAGAGEWSNAFTSYFLAHSLGNLVFFPLFSLMVSGQIFGWIGRLGATRLAELVLLCSGLMLASAVALLQTGLLPWLIPILAALFITFRLGMPAASIAVALLALPPWLGAALGTTVPLPALANEQFLQFYLFAAVICLQPLARHITQNRRLMLTLKEKERNESGTELSLRVKDFAISESQSLYRLLAENMTDIILKTDRDGHILYASPSSEKLGLRPLELLGSHVLELIPSAYDASFMAAHDAVLASGEETTWVEYPGLSTAGDEMWFDTHMRCVTDRNGRAAGVVIVMRSIEERKILEQQLFAATLTDPLTNLTNRRAFSSMLQYHLDVPIDGCLAMFDIDNFRAINHKHGHEAGDKVLTTVAKLLRALLRKDDIISRIGGERFAVLLSRASPDQAEVLCRRIVSTLSDMSGAEDIAGPRITVSAGVARIEGTLDETMKRADSAVVIAKAKGRNRLEVATRTRLRWAPAQQDYRVEEPEEGPE